MDFSQAGPAIEKKEEKKEKEKRKRFRFLSCQKLQVCHRAR